jgi:hypothetical protein
MERRNEIAQWAFDTRGILGRFHLWLEDVELSRPDGLGEHESFPGEALERAFVTAGAVTALGTRLFGRYGEGRGKDKAELNRVKKDADAISAYVLSESLWSLTRNLPENHAVMVGLGEGLMPKAGETPEMGANPQLGFGRVYARPQVALFVDRCVQKLLNRGDYGWNEFWREVQGEGISLWGAAVDTLENTSRFANGAATGPMTVLNLFDQPLRVARPYEGYMGMLVLPADVVEEAAELSVLLDYHTPRPMVMQALLRSYPGLAPERVHVWTLDGPSRKGRLGQLWTAWEELGAHRIEDGWVIPETGGRAFTDSGTFAPSFRVGPFRDAGGAVHVLIVDGYAASAEAIQSATLDPVLGTRTSLCLFSSRFEGSYLREAALMRLDPEASDYPYRLEEVLGGVAGRATVDAYWENLRDARAACLPLGRRTLSADDFFPNKEWRVLSIASCMCPDPYTGLPGVEEVGADVYRVTTRSATRGRVTDVTLTLRTTQGWDDMRMTFSPLLDRFYAGQDFTQRPVRVSDSGRIRNELQTLCAEAIEYLPGERMRVHFDRLDDQVMAADKKALIKEVLGWYRDQHPVWFGWLEW